MGKFLCIVFVAELFSLANVIWVIGWKKAEAFEITYILDSIFEGHC